MISTMVVGLIKESKLRLPSKVASCCNTKGFVSGVLGTWGFEIEGFCQNGKLSRAQWRMYIPRLGLVMITVGFLWAARR